MNNSKKKNKQTTFDLAISVRIRFLGYGSLPGINILTY